LIWLFVRLFVCLCGLVVDVEVHAVAVMGVVVVDVPMSDLEALQRC
jgi:hypothetical protein